ncbi:hypothetical protein [Methylorubrum sp. SB2]|uniref:hypothetical protein n=1 Tax=Methylorubrum subtropicum TaxID=3138812 RepID=UPI00313D48FB
MPDDAPARAGGAETLRRRPKGEADTAFRGALRTADHGAPFRDLAPPRRDPMRRPMFDGSRLLHRLRFPHARREIAEADGAPVGRIVTDRGARGLTLIDLAVVPGRRGGASAPA